MYCTIWLNICNRNVIFVLVYFEVALCVCYDSSIKYNEYIEICIKKKRVGALISIM